MSKVLTFLLFALTLSFVGFAAPSYWVAVETTAYPAASESGVADVNNYALYYCQVGTEALGGATSVKDIQAFLSTAKNYVDTRKAATMFDSVGYSDGEYSIIDYRNAAFSGIDYVAIAFYGYEAYRVYGYDIVNSVGSAELTPNGQLVFNEAYAASGNVGTWQRAVPEPTSALLMLLGFAGLALRRKSR